MEIYGWFELGCTKYMCANTANTLKRPFTLSNLLARSLVLSFVRLINRIPNLLIDFFVCKSSFCNQRMFQRSFPMSLIIRFGSNFISRLERKDVTVDVTHRHTQRHERDTDWFWKNAIVVRTEAKKKSFSFSQITNDFSRFVETYQSEISLMRNGGLWDCCAKTINSNFATRNAIPRPLHHALCCEYFIDC